MKKFFFLGFALGASILFLAAWLLTSMFDLDLGGDGGSNFTVLEQLDSPDGRYTAFTYVHSGGGAAGWCFEHVCIDNDNLFPYSEKYDVFQIVPAQTDIRLNWIDATTLEIIYFPTSNQRTTVWRNQSRQFEELTVVFRQNL